MCILTTTPHICAYDCQAGYSQSLLGHQLGKLQFPAALSSWKNKYRCRCLIKYPGWGAYLTVQVLSRITAVAVQAVQEVALKGPVSPIEAYSCNLHILDVIQDSQQVACMTLEDWHQAQQVILS